MGPPEISKKSLFLQHKNVTYSIIDIISLCSFQTKTDQKISKYEPLKYPFQICTLKYLLSGSWL